MGGLASPRQQADEDVLTTAAMRLRVSGLFFVPSGNKEGDMRQMYCDWALSDVVMALLSMPGLSASERAGLAAARPFLTPNWIGIRGTGMEYTGILGRTH